jgi:hypothetical protein
VKSPLHQPNVYKYERCIVRWCSRAPCRDAIEDFLLHRDRWQHGGVPDYLAEAIDTQHRAVRVEDFGEAVGIKENAGPLEGHDRHGRRKCLLW